MTVTTDVIDLPAYLNRIGYSGSLEPTPELLAEFVKRHMAAIPFEAIDVLLDKGVDLAPEAIDRKLLVERRGGYCFEHASLMRRALRAVGFTVDQHLARVRVHDGLEGPTPPATHASLKVEAGGRLWLVDVGFGGFMPNEPLAWRPHVAQRTDFGTFRLVETRDGWLVELQHREQWSPLYEILDFHWQEADFKVANHYVASHLDSHFRHVFMVALTGSQGRATLAGNRLKYAGIECSRDEYILDVDGLAKALAVEFGLPVADDWTPLLERVADGAVLAASV